MWWFNDDCKSSVLFLPNVLFLFSLHSCLIWVTDTAIRDHVGCFTLGTVCKTSQNLSGQLCFFCEVERGELTRRVLNLGHPLLASAFPEQDPRGRSMR